MTKKQRELISRRTKEGLRAAKARGVKLGNPRPTRNLRHLTPLAVARIKQKADDFAAKWFPLIAGLLNKGWTLTAIAAELNKRRFSTSRKRRWYAATVRNVALRKVSAKDLRLRAFRYLLRVGAHVGPLPF
jgi:DNA invertase Pin-like site-specific DNA recombinase